MFTHQLSCSKEEYSAITSGKKSFILTKDQDYVIGDNLLIQHERSEKVYPVTLIEKDVPGLSKNWVAIAFENKSDAK